MNNDFGITNTHIYKPKRWTLILNVFNLFFTGIIMGIPLITLVLMIISSFQANKRVDIFAIIIACTLAPIIILLVFNIFQMTINVVISFFSYVKITADGIEQKHSPYKHIRSRWSDVDKLGKLFLFADIIYLNSYEILGTSLSLKSPFRFFRPKQDFISITGYEGWPDGQLANDLKQYAPSLFENLSMHQKNQPENKDVEATETPSLSQEIRLLAAISHAAVLFTNIGFLVPIGIYLTQKKKSSYLGFQALQALVWQFVMILFTMLISVCMIGSFFIPILLTTVAPYERFLNLSAGTGFVTAIISVFLITFGNLVFIIYGIIGAIMTYQGKDFRYIFIGNRIKKMQN